MFIGARPGESQISLVPFDPLATTYFSPTRPLEKSTRFESGTRANPFESSFGANWDAILHEQCRSHTVTTQYDGDVESFVEKCPFHLFDTKRNRNISRSELSEDISSAIKDWIKLPLSCSDIERTIVDIDTPFSHFYPHSESDNHLHPFVYSALTKSPVIDGVDNFISALTDELKLYCGYYCTGMPQPSLDDILEEVRQLIKWKRTQSSIPSRQEVHLLIQLFGQYAILSHRWGEEELSFADVANLPDSTVEAKKGFGKLTAFAKAVKTYYGCRYLWMDTICIDDADRDRSIALMFGWYRHAYICIIYLGHSFSEQPWFSRGWTLQEFIAASRIAIFTRDSGAWYPNLRWQNSDSDSRIRDLAKYFRQSYFEPRPDAAIVLFHEMRRRETKLPEDRVYCLLSALDADIPIAYGEGFDSAFDRLQVHCLTRTSDRRLLCWNSHPTPSSPRNSMLAPDFEAFKVAYVNPIFEFRPRKSLNTSISFDACGLMRIMVSLFPWDGDVDRESSTALHRPPLATSRLVPLAFASLHFGKDNVHCGVLLRRVRLTATNPPGRVYGGDGSLGEDGRVIYERVSFKAVRSSELPFHDSQRPEWVHIR